MKENYMKRNFNEFKRVYEFIFSYFERVIWNISFNSNFPEILIRGIYNKKKQIFSNFLKKD